MTSAVVAGSSLAMKVISASASMAPTRTADALLPLVVRTSIGCARTKSLCGEEKATSGNDEGRLGLQMQHGQQRSRKPSS